MRKRLAITTAALALLAPAAAAEAGSYKTARFVAYAQGTQVTKWKVPRYPMGGDCQGNRFRESGGEETIRWRTKPMKILVEKPPAARYPNVKYGTWSQFDESPRPALQAKGRVYRAGFEHHIVEPGWCFGGGPTVTDTGPYDCGLRAYKPRIYLSWEKGKVTLSTLATNNVTYDNCPFGRGLGIIDGQWSTTDQAYPLHDLFDRSQGLVEVLGEKTWTDQIGPGEIGVTSSTTKFKLRLRRAR
jgi:hypothetical protein